MTSAHVNFRLISKCITIDLVDSQQEKGKLKTRSLQMHSLVVGFVGAARIASCSIRYPPTLQSRP